MAERPDESKQSGATSLLAGLLDFWLGVTSARAGHLETQLRISGNSMLPALPNGSAVVVRHTKRGIVPGALIAFRRDGDLIVHRVVAVRRGPRGRVFLTKGDYNRRCDPLVAESEVLGRVVAVETGGDPRDQDGDWRRGRQVGSWRRLLRWARLD